MSTSENRESGPLTEVVFYILLALHQPRHGYGIMQYIEEITKGRVVMGAGTLYGALNTLQKKRWIQELDDQADGRKKEFIITRQGRAMFAIEVKRIKQLLKHAQKITA